MKRILLVMSILCTTFVAVAGSTASVELEPYPDQRAYAVYSAALGIDASKPGRFLVQQMTVRIPRACLKPSGPLAEKVAEAGVDLMRHDGKSYRLDDAFTPHGFVDVRSDEELRTARMKAPEGPNGWQSTTQFSAVGFSQDASVAVLFFGQSCGMLCGHWRTAAFVMNEGRWTELPNQSPCVMVS